MLSDSEEEDTVVKIENVLDEIDEENCIAMGGIDDKSVCTFIRGYVKRQALYTCRTCLNIDEVKAGICFPCAMECHADHDVVELYTKRRFRCDCGNAKFAGVNGCLLWENFSNRYCTCHRPYPDPDYDGVEEMIQCGICENWFHLEISNPPENYNEMTCFMCIRKLLFFRFTQSGDNSLCHLSVWASKMKHTYPMFRYSSLDSINNVDTDLVPSVFWISDWRGFLCRCDDCKKMYMYFQVEFLLDPEDSVSFYMQLGKQRTKSINDEEKRTLDEALAELPHHVAVNFATGFARLKEALEEFFTKKRGENHV
ncbi:putative E3 ubiquitin-protein ligase UBR7 [Schistosoma japonicum]|uniref:Putative E3 ubiquitin-protein ligase UBR7 n=1 Tax=Schistosoma japonicum TaxID=6182 RepID=A0A4Z2DFL2_SCHJA|nr:putative E3 ubiquitin-protein ligase UBR7 [Schistosoma japonicum]